MDPLGALADPAALLPAALLPAGPGSNDDKKAARVVDWTSLTAWANAPSKIRKTEQQGETTRGGEQQAPKFTVSEDINKKIYLWYNGDITNLSVDAVVNSTNETLNERNGVSEKIMTLAGKDILSEVQFLEGCRTGEAKITGGHRLPARHIIHTVGPRYNIKYKTAAESALHSCYRSSMELVKENRLSSIAFTVINSVRRGYPPEAGAHMSLRTIRRFLEKFGNGIDAVVFVLDDEVDVKAYDGTIPLYFPRNAVELEYSVRHLPDDVGNDLGEPVQSERKIRIGDIPRAQLSTSNFLNQSNISEDNPMSSWADPSRESEMPELSADMTTLINKLSELRGDHDAIRKEEMHNKESTGQEDTIRRYQRWLRRARNEDLSDLTKMNIIYSAGTDSIGRTVVCVVAKHYNSYVVDRDRMLLHVIDKLDLISNKDFIVVFFSTDSASENRPDYSFIRDMYNILHPKYRRNLKALYIVHSNWWVRLSIMIMNAFFTSDIREKILMVDRLVDLYDKVALLQTNVPDFVKQYDVTVNGVSQPTAALSADAL